VKCRFDSAAAGGFLQDFVAQENQMTDLEIDAFDQARGLV